MAMFQIGDTWYVDYYQGKGSKRKRVREAVGPRKKDAEAYLGKIKAAQRENRLFDMKKEYNHTFDELLEKYKSTFRGQKYYPTKEYYFPVYVQHFSGMLLGDIAPHQIEKFRNERKETPVKTGLQKLHAGYRQRTKNPKVAKERSNAAVNRELSTLRHIFSKAVEWDMIDTSPFSRLKGLFYKEESRLRYLSEQEEICLLNVCQGTIRKIVLVALHSGMRLGEIFNLKWSDIQNGFIYLTKTKTYMPRQIPINKTLTEVFDSVPRHINSEYVFWGKDGGPLTSVSRPFKNAIRQAGIKEFTFHDLRHTFASKLVMKGASLKAVQELLGHKDIKMTMRYAHLAEDIKKDAVKLLDGDGENEYGQKVDKNKRSSDGQIS